AYPQDINAPTRVLQILQPLPLRFSRLGASIQLASAEYEKLQYLRRPLKWSFVLALTLITLMTTLLSLWLAIYSTRRLIAPLKELAAGTRAVAAGDYQTRLPVESRDELGLLVGSFNDMIGEIRRAQDHAQQNQRLVEEQKGYLQTVLSHLLSGVLTFDHEGRLLTYNAAAEQILLVKLASGVNRPCTEICTDEEWVRPFFDAISRAMESDIPEWREEITLTGPEGHQVLVQRGTRLQSEAQVGEGYVVVFDDATGLIQTQRNAAWGEVARRLAHEIKNPLTPIQLSAERIRRKYLDKVDSDDREALDRATRTIAQQVESLKRMVNAFSNYAQPMKMKPATLDLNRLIRDVVELHRHEQSALTFRLQLDPDLPPISADPDRMRQVLNNLLINTRDATVGTPDPEAAIRTGACTLSGQPGVELVIEDNGPGFPEEMIERIFEPYVTSKKKGTGLGLAIVKRIVEEHGGMIRAGNAESGGGRVTMRLPVEKQKIRQAPVNESQLTI
ncbi:MAG: ATP-binding protein, partial [Pseudomonadota bacterium]|nr:ATP-binding protein [Pseudomonadota bacterium]